MNEKMIEAAKRHLARPMKMVLEDETGNKDEFLIKPLEADDIPEFLEASSIFVDATESNPTAWLKSLTKDKALKLIRVAKRSIQLSYPEWDESTVNSFVASNLMPILEIVFQINQLGGRIKAKEKEKMQKIKELMHDKSSRAA